jgi:probable O-glycosylation ligase (exosortase A-associated)
VKQTLLMIALTLAGTVGVLFNGPFIALAVYYLYGVLRPQYLWRWALSWGVTWSEYVAWAAILGTLGHLMNSSLDAGASHTRRFAFGHAAYVMFGLWLVITYFTALDQDQAYRWMIDYVKIFTMFGVAAIVVTNLRQVWTLYLIATGALIYIAYELNFVYFTDGRVDIYRNGYGGLDNNGAGLMLAMGLPLTIYAWEATRQWWRWIFAAGVPLLIHAVLMSYSRGAMVSLLVTAPLVMLRSRRRWQFLAMFIAIALVVPTLAGREIRDRFFTIQDYENDRDANLRFNSWMAAVRIANEYPVFGAGIRNANLVSFQYGADMDGRTIHSQYLQTLADNGYVGLALYLLALGSAWVAIIRSRRALKNRTDPDALLHRSITSGIEGSLAVFCVGAVFLSLEVFELPYLLGLLSIQSWVIARAAVSSETAETEAQTLTKLPSTPGRLQEAKL